MDKIEVIIDVAKATGALVFLVRTQESGLSDDDKQAIIEEIKTLVGFDTGLARTMKKIERIAEKEAEIPGHNPIWEEILERIKVNGEEYLTAVSHATQGGFALTDIVRLAHCAVDLYKNPGNETVYQSLGELAVLFEECRRKGYNA